MYAYNGVAKKGELNLHLKSQWIISNTEKKKKTLYLSYLEHQKKLFLWQVGFGDEMGSYINLLFLP